jgi:hypothetical protein
MCYHLADLIPIGKTVFSSIRSMGCLEGSPGECLLVCFRQTAFNRLSLVNQWQLRWPCHAFFTPPVTSAKANDPYLAAPQKSPSDVQNLPNAYALPLTSVASGSTESTASGKNNIRVRWAK